MNPMGHIGPSMAKESSTVIKLSLNPRELKFVQSVARQLSTPLRITTPQDAIRHVLAELDAKLAAETAPLFDPAGFSPAGKRAKKQRA